MRATLLPEGTFAYWANGPEWAIQQTVQQPTTDGSKFVRIHVLRTYEGQVLNYEIFRRLSEPKEDMPMGKLKRNLAYYNFTNGGVGRHYGVYGQIEVLLRRLDNVRITSNAMQINIVGTLDKEKFVFSLSTQYGYLATEAYAELNGRRHGYRIESVQKIGRSWFPRRVTSFSGRIDKGNVTDGTSGTLEFSKLLPASQLSESDFPRLAAGTVIGSEDNILYRMKQDGKLEYWGQQGRKRKTSIVWGSVFVGAGAILLLTCLSWIVFRNSKSKKPSR